MECEIRLTQIRREEPDDFLPDFETEIPFEPFGVEE
jgi:hypothetical protein